MIALLKKGNKAGLVIRTCARQNLETVAVNQLARLFITHGLELRTCYPLRLLVLADKTYLTADFIGCTRSVARNDDNPYMGILTTHFQSLGHIFPYWVGNTYDTQEYDFLRIVLINTLIGETQRTHCTLLVCCQSLVDLFFSSLTGNAVTHGQNDLGGTLDETYWLFSCAEDNS